MAGKAGFVVDVTVASFESVVLQAPAEVVVVVDFWASWCAPCKMLSPILERAVESLAGKAILAKVNVDEEQELGQRYGVQGIPAIKIFREGEIVQEFVGALPEADIRRMLESVVPSEADEILRDADALFDSGEYEEAGAYLRQALEVQGRHPGALFRLARLALREGDLDAAERYALKVEEDTGEYEEARALLDCIAFGERCRDNGGLDACLAAVKQNENDLDACFNLGFCYAAEGRYEEALETLLSVIAKNKNYKDGAAKEAMVRIFGIIGQRNPVSDRYRSKLQSTMY